MAKLDALLVDGFEYPDTERLKQEAARFLAANANSGDHPEPLFDAQVSAADIRNLAVTAQVVTGFALSDIEDEPRIVALIGAVDAIKREADCLQTHLTEVGRQTNVA